MPSKSMDVSSRYVEAYSKTEKPAPVIPEPEGTVLCPDVVMAPVERKVERCKRCKRHEVWSHTKKLCYECWRESLGYMFDANQNRFVLEGK